MNEILPFVIAGIATGAILGLAGTGLVLTYKTSGIFNFGHGAVAAAAAYVFYFLQVQQQWPWWAALLVVVLVLGPGCGLLMSAIGRRVASQRPVLKIVATVGVILVVYGLATARYGYDPLLMPQYLPHGNSTFRVGGVYVSYAQLTILVVSLVIAGALYLFFRFGRLGLRMRAVVDDPDLVGLHGTDAVRVQRVAWVIGSSMAALSGVLIAPITGIEATALTFLVVQAFGAAAFGAFASLPLTYLGALVVGVLASLCSKFVLTVPNLAGLPTALPFVLLIIALVAIPRRKLVQPSRPEARPAVPWTAPPKARLVMGALTVLVLAGVPLVVGVNLSYFTVGLTQALLLLSLGLLVRTAGLASLCQGAFAAIGAAAFGHFATHLPWGFALILGALVVVPVAALLALPAIRLSGLFLALATFGFGLLMEAEFYPLSFFFTSAGTGLPMPRPAGFGSDQAYYYLVLAVFVVGALAMVLLHRSRLGRTLRGLGEAPLALGTLGLNANLTRTIVCCVSGFVAGIAGALYGAQVHFAVLGDAHYSAYSSLVLLAILAVSPGREPWYAIVAALSAIIPAYWTAPQVDSWLDIIFGFFAVLVAMQGGTQPMPKAIRRLTERLAGRRKPDPGGVTPEKSTKEYVARKAPIGGGLEVRGLTVRYGGRVAVDGVDLTAPTGQITGLIGPNGAGKTTTFNAVNGLLRPSAGAVLLHGKDVSRHGPGARGRLGLGRTFQLMQLCDSLTVAQNVGLGVEAGLAGSRLRGQLFATAGEAARTRQAVREALELCGIQRLAHEQAGALSTGQRRLVELARCLAGGFDLLLLDEPSSGLDVVETEQFGATLRRVVAERGCGVLLVEHDMGLVLTICARIHVLDFGRLLFTGTPEEVRSSATVQAAYLGSQRAELAAAVPEELTR